MKLMYHLCKFAAVSALSLTLTAHPTFAGTRCAGLLPNERNIVVLQARTSYILTWLHVQRIGTSQYIVHIAVRGKWHYVKSFRGRLGSTRVLIANGVWVDRSGQSYNVCHNTLIWR